MSNRQLSTGPLPLLILLISLSLSPSLLARDQGLFEDVQELFKKTKDQIAKLTVQVDKEGRYDLAGTLSEKENLASKLSVDLMDLVEHREPRHLKDYLKNLPRARQIKIRYFTADKKINLSRVPPDYLRDHFHSFPVDFVESDIAKRPDIRGYTLLVPKDELKAEGGLLPVYLRPHGDFNTVKQGMVKAGHPGFTLSLTETESQMLRKLLAHELEIARAANLVPGLAPQRDVLTNLYVRTPTPFRGEQRRFGIIPGSLKSASMVNVTGENYDHPSDLRVRVHFGFRGDQSEQMDLERLSEFEFAGGVNQDFVPEAGKFYATRVPFGGESDLVPLHIVPPGETSGSVLADPRFKETLLNPLPVVGDREVSAIKYKYNRTVPVIAAHEASRFRSRIYFRPQSQIEEVSQADFERALNNIKKDRGLQRKIQWSLASLTKIPVQKTPLTFSTDPEKKIRLASEKGSIIPNCASKTPMGGSLLSLLRPLTQ